MSDRLYYIDALRSFAMLYGLLVHAGTLNNEPLTYWVAVTSDHFRMATFFFVSGFFAGMVSGRRGDSAFIRGRSQALLIPLVFGVLVLNPLTNWLIYYWHSGPVSFFAYLAGERPWPRIGQQNWHLHLWFLISLFCCILLVPTTRRLLSRSPTSRLLNKLASLGIWCIPAVAVMVVGWEIGGRAVWRFTLEGPLNGTALQWVPRATIDYAVYFFLGLAALSCSPLLAAMHRFSLLTLGVGAALYILLWRLPESLPSALVTTVEIAAEETVTVACLCSLLLVFRHYFSAKQPWLITLSRSVYTVYLVHFLLIYLFAFALEPFVDNFYALYVLVVVASGLGGYLFHVRLVARVSWLQWLLNGKTSLAGQPQNTG